MSTHETYIKVEPTFTIFYKYEQNTGDEMYQKMKFDEAPGTGFKMSSLL